jgi:glycosyltransferase involved in cell wall biosynthesis
MNYTGRRVLMLVENAPYPQDSRVRKEAKTLAEAGYQVTVISPAAKGQPWLEVTSDARVYRYPFLFSGRGFLGYLVEYGYAMVAMFLLSLWVVVRNGFDIVHTANPPDTLVLIAAFYKMFGKRFVYDHHDLCPEMYRARLRGRGSRAVYRVLLIFEKLSCRLADHVIATNESYKNIEIRRTAVPAHRITVVRNGPELERERSLPPDPDLNRKASIVIAFLGNMGLQDGLDYLLHALCQLDRLGRKEWSCVLIGDGDARSGLEKLATRLKIADRVWFTGYLPSSQYLHYLPAVDICVDPAPSNAYNNSSTMVKVMEYMALGKPVVLFDLPEHRVTAQDAARYVRPNDELEFARVLVELMDDPAQRDALGRQGRKRVETVLAWQYSVPALLDAYRKVHDQPQGTRAMAAEPGAAAIERRVSSRPAPWKSVRTHFLRLIHWARQRHLAYIGARALTLARRYGITAEVARKRVLKGVQFLVERGCHPTLPTPGRLVARHGKLCSALQEMGAELAVHGYDHVDFRALTPAEAHRQFSAAVEAFQRAGIEVHGFRCPYLSYSEDVLKAASDRAFTYSSNLAIAWDVAEAGARSRMPGLCDQLRKFYRPKSSASVVCVPRAINGLVEIPASLPDDLLLFDGLGTGEAGLADSWTAMLRESHRRGELFALLFHTEIFDRCLFAFDQLLREAKTLQPEVWVTRLREVSAWWREKAAFRVEVDAHDANHLRLEFCCSPSATVLARHLSNGTAEPWDGEYHIVRDRSLIVPAEPRPFIGLSPDMSGAVATFLREQGYITEVTDNPNGYGVYLDAAATRALGTEVQIVNYIESVKAPLVRFWRWPHGARSAFCITGDLDALSLPEYALRLFTL